MTCLLIFGRPQFLPSWSPSPSPLPPHTSIDKSRHQGMPVWSVSDDDTVRCCVIVVLRWCLLIFRMEDPKLGRSLIAAAKLGCCLRCLLVVVATFLPSVRQSLTSLSAHCWGHSRRVLTINALYPRSVRMGPKSSVESAIG